MERHFRFCRFVSLFLTVVMLVSLMGTIPASAKTISFKDVKDEKLSYYVPAYWSAENKIITGFKKKKFKPDSTVKVSSMLTYIWRVAGKPEPKTKENPFKDVKTKAAYYKAALWCVENKIVKLPKSKKLNPNKKLQKGQALEMVWKFAGKPKAKSKKNPYKDIKKKNSYYKAALWAGENGLIAGKGKLKPKSIALRKDIVIFLYQICALAKEGKIKPVKIDKDISVKTETPAGEKTPEDVKEPEEEDQGYKGYKYEVIPLVAPFNSYFFIKTDNPDPESFSFKDPDSKYADKDSYGTITPTLTQYADVVYEKKDTARVKGGYIATGSKTDGGELILVDRTVTGEIPVLNLNTGVTKKEKQYSTTDTDYKVKTEAVVDNADYLIDTYGKDKTDFFDRMDAIQSGFNSVCLYSGVSVRSNILKDEKSFWGVSTSPHKDQAFYIQDPYYSANDGKSMLISGLYPFRYDSLGFPGMLSTIARRINPKVQISSTDAHYLVSMTLDGKTRSYGGAGTGGGQGITEDLIKYFYKFDSSADDAAKDMTLATTKSRITEYGKMTVAPLKKEGEITWSDIAKSVGSGSYMKVHLILSIFGGGAKGYTYMYSNGSSTSYFSNAWFDGRYFNSYEFFEKGTKFGGENEEANTAAIVIKDPVAKVPSDGNDYKYNGYYLNKYDKYDPETGTWSGYYYFRYDKDSDCWISGIYSSLTYYDTGKKEYLKCEDKDFKDALTLTRDEIKEMGIDANADQNPSEFLIYDMTEEPGTKGKL